MSFPAIITTSNNKQNITVNKMDNPNITMDDLFAQARASMKRYEDKHKKPLVKKKSHTTKHHSTTAMTRRIQRQVSQEAAVATSYVPLCEIRRQKEKASLEALRSMAPKYKPLSWNKPSFHFPSSKTCENESKEPSTQSCSSSTAQIGEKRKAAHEESSSTDNGNMNSAESILTKPRPANSSAISISTSAAASLLSTALSYSQGNSSYIIRPKWSKDEVRGLMDFANKWITADNMNNISKRRKIG